MISTATRPRYGHEERNLLGKANKIKNTVQSYWLNNSAELLRKDNLVYARTLKCASTYYDHLLRFNGWQPISFESVNWNHEHVFSFILDPWQRYLKGLTEDIVTNFSIEEHNILLSLGTNFFQNYAVAGEHTIPLSTYWGDKIYKIDWIPIDQAVKSEQLLTHLLMLYNQTIRYPSNLNIHESTDYKSRLYQEIKNKIGSGNHVIYKTLAKDIDLYNSVIAKINLQGESWDQISWLRK